MLCKPGKFCQVKYNIFLAIIMDTYLPTSSQERNQYRVFRSSRPKVFCKKGILKNCYKINRKTSRARVSFLIKLQTRFIKKEILAQVFCCESCKKMLKNLSYGTSPVAASECSESNWSFTFRTCFLCLQISVFHKYLIL